MKVRKERPADVEQIRAVNAKAFGRDAEADLVDALRESGVRFLSLVAERDGDIVGHILFTPVELVGGSRDLKLAGLGPMAVTPERQKQGIGSRLVEAGMQACREAGYDAVIVLGHPAYYPHFGFAPASNFGIRSEYRVPDEVFMLLELNPGALEGNQGLVRYHDAFKNV
jgi:putative acetyltransferase